ncbi:MAG: DUF58 domain-containing protein [Planctomycetaceae bacterium]
MGTRAFRQGDSLRRVHWAQTARQGRMIVCERQASSGCAVRLLVDLTTVHHDQVRTAQSTLETVLRAAATICESLHQQHATIECWLGQRRYLVAGSAVDYRELMDALAAVPANGLEQGWPTWFGRDDVWTVALTTREGWENLGPRAMRRAIAVTPGSVVAGESSATSAWLTIPSGVEWRDLFPARWRRACHVA